MSASPETAGNVYLVGMPGSGKSTVGRLVAERLGARFVDLDEEVARAAGGAIETIFAEVGELRFRDLEEEALAKAGASDGAVVACGGGVVLREANREVLTTGRAVVFVDVPVAVLQERVACGVARPLIQRPTDVAELEARRRALYERVSTFAVDGDQPPEAVAAAIAERLP